MAKKELKKMSKNELIEIIYALQNNEENEKIPEIDEVKKERNHISYQKRYRKALRSTAGILIVIAAIAVLVATIFFPFRKLYRIRLRFLSDLLLICYYLSTFFR